MTDSDAFYNLDDAIEHYQKIYSEYDERLSDKLSSGDRVYSYYMCFEGGLDISRKIEIYFKPAHLDWSHKKGDIND